MKAIIMNTVCLLFENKDNQQLLREMLAERFKIINAADSIPMIQCDMFISDGLSLDRFGNQFIDRKKKESTSYLPFLLVTAHPQPDLFFRNWWDIIDDVIEIPVRRSILYKKIEILLRVRNQSLELSNKNGELINSLTRLSLSMIFGKISFWEMDIDTGEFFLSEEWKNQLGCPHGPSVNDEKELLDRIHPDDLQKFKDELKKIIQNRFHNMFVVCRMRCNGNYSWFQLRSTVISDNNGNKNRLLVSQVDITEQKIFELQCLEREKELAIANYTIREHNKIIEKDKKVFDIIMDTLPVGLIQVNTEGEIISSSRHFQKLFGNVNGRSVFEIAHYLQVHRSDKSETDKTMLLIYRAMHDKTVIRNEEMIIDRVNDTNIITLGNAAPVLDDKGNTEGGVLIFLDITTQKMLQKELQSERELLRTLLDNIPVMLKIYSSDMKILKLNNTFERVTGWNFEDSKYTNLVEKVYPDPKYRQKVIDLMRSLTPEYNDLSMISKEGKVIESSWSFNKLPDGRLVGIGIDITGRKKAEKALQESEERFHTLADNISQLAWMANPQGEIFWYNKRWYEFTGTTYEIMKREGVKKVIHSNHFDHVISSFQRAIQDGKPWEDTFLMLRANGGYCWFLTRAMPIRNQKGKIIRWFGTNTDITDIRNLQEQVKNEREVLQTIFDNIPVMLTIYNPQDLLFKVNKTIVDLTGWNKDVLEGADVLERLFPDQQYREEVIKFALSEKTVYREFIMNGKNGNKLYVDWATIKVPDGRRVGVGIDLSEIKKAQEGLRIAAERFQLVTSSNIIGTVIADFQGKLLFVNDYFLNITGFTQDDFKQNRISWKDMTPSEFQQLDNKALEELEKERINLPYEKQYIRKDGKRVWVLVSGFLLPGQEKQIFGFVLDITDRKKALDEALRRKAEIESILNSLPDGLIIFEPDGNIRQTNNRAREVFGFSEKGTSIQLREQLQHIKYFTPDGQIFPKNRIPSYRAFQGEIVRDEIINIRSADKNYWLSESASPIAIDGKFLGVVMEFSDITRLHNLQEQLVDERNFVDTIMQTSGALIAVLDKNNNFIRFNRTCEELTGYKSEEVVGKSLYELFIIEEETEALKNIYGRLLAGEKSIEYENHWRTRSGDRRYIRWRNTVLNMDHRGVAFIIKTGIDISDRKRLQEELLISNRDLESFSYSISHDLRGPLGIVEGFVNIISEEYGDVLDKEGQEYLQHIMNSVRKMQDLINSLLILSRAGKHEIKRQKLNLSEMVLNYCQELKKAEPDRMVELIIQRNVYANADPKLLQIAMENLLRNAWKFTSKNEIAKIEFGSIILHEKTTFFIRDNGAGFDMQFAEKIFEPFKRVHKEKEYTGTGVGLSIVLRAIKRHGGRIWAEGNVNNGAVFFFTLEP